MFGPVDWDTMFVPKIPLVELFIRGTLMYFALFLMLRFAFKREAGGVSLSDLLVVVVIADAAQNGMASDYKSIPGGVFLCGTIVFWSYAIDWLAWHVPLVARIVHPPPLTLIRDGQINRRNMRRELITMPELMSQLREQGIERIDEVHRACMEGDGRISVVKKNGEQPTKRK